MDLLADAVVALWGGGRSIGCKRIGIRVGEKLHEVLVNEYEMLRARDSGDFFVIPPQTNVELNGDSASNAFPEYTSACTTQVENVFSRTRLTTIASSTIGDSMTMQTNDPARHARCARPARMPQIHYRGLAKTRSWGLLRRAETTLEEPNSWRAGC